MFQAACLQHSSNESVFPQRKSASVCFILFKGLLVGLHIKAT